MEITNTRHKIHRHLLFQKDSVIIIFLQGYFHFSERGRERNSRPKEYSLYFGREFFFFHWAIFHHQQLCVNRILESSKQEWWWWWWLVKKSEEKINNKNRWIPLGIVVVVVVWWYTLTWILDSLFPPTYHQYQSKHSHSPFIFNSNANAFHSIIIISFVEFRY